MRSKAKLHKNFVHMYSSLHRSYHPNETNNLYITAKNLNERKTTDVSQISQENQGGRVLEADKAPQPKNQIRSRPRYSERPWLLQFRKYSSQLTIEW